MLSSLKKRLKSGIDALEAIHAAKVGIIRRFVSSAILATLYFGEQISTQMSKMADRDTEFVLSRSCGLPALYAALGKAFTVSEMMTLRWSGQQIPGHLI